MRYKGIGMPKAKKKRVTVVESVPEEAMEEEEPPEPPQLPATPPKKPQTVAPQSPTKTVLLKAQRYLRNLTMKTRKKVLALDVWSEKHWEVAQRLFDVHMKSIEQTQKRNAQYNPFKELRRAHKAEMALAKAYHERTYARLCASDALLKLAEAECLARDAKIARLTCQLRVARRAAKYRRGWSTTRVRFRI